MMLQREKDAAERNAWHLSEALRGMTHGELDGIYIMSTVAARTHISMSFPWMTSRARNKLMHTIHGNGGTFMQKRRRKTKGGGSFNEYGSEGPSHGAASSWQLLDEDFEECMEDAVMTPLLTPSYPEFAGSMPHECLTEPRQHRIDEGNNALQEHASTCMYSVLPVQADGECFLRSMALQLRTQNLAGASLDIVKHYRVLSVLLLEALMAENRYMKEMILPVRKFTAQCTKGCERFFDSVSLTVHMVMPFPVWEVSMHTV